MARVNVFLKDDLLKAIDAEASASRTNRSALMQSALTGYLEARQREREAAAIQREIKEACLGMDALAGKLGKWDPVKAIRDSRDNRSPRASTPRSRQRKATRKGHV